MIQLAGLDEIPRGDPRARLRDRRGGRGRLPEQRRAMWIGGGSISIPGDPLGSAGSINFATLFPGAFQVIQSDIGVTYNGTLAPNPANTATTALTLGGPLTPVNAPILVQATNSAAIGAGGAFAISFDDGGSFPMVGIVPAVGVPVPLTGLASALTLTWAAGTSVNGNTWKAACAAWADQSGNARHYTSPVGFQPRITLGLNGFVGVASFGAGGGGTYMTSGYAVPATTTPLMVLGVFRAKSWAANSRLLGDIAQPNKCAVLQISGVSPQISIYDSVEGGQSSDLAINAWGVLEAKWNNSAADYIQVGSGAQHTGNCGNVGAGTGRQIFGTLSGGIGFSDYELLALVHTAPVSSAAFRAAVAAKYAGLVAG